MNKKTLILLLILFTPIRIFSKDKLPSWLDKAVFYQIYPQSFKDSDGDGIGDLNGITQKIDYLSNLGITAIWLNPIFESPFKDAGYDVSDFYKIAPRYGNIADIKNLTNIAHKKGIKVVLDLVAGHTSDQHSWFKESALGKKNKYTDFYIWTPSKEIKPENYVTGNFERNGNYKRNFFDCQPALNYGFATKNNNWEQSIDSKSAKMVRHELKNIIAFWMDKGIDGFRVDMASSLIKNDSNLIENTNMWIEIRNWYSKKYPDGVLIAEWSNPKQAVNAGFMIDFMMHFNVPGYPSLFFNNGGVFKRENAYFDIQANGSPFEFISNYTEQIQSVAEKGFVSIPTGNHDINRLNAGRRNTDEQLKTALFFILTIKGVPFIYYGDEIGIPYTEDLEDKEGSVLVNLNNENRAGSRTPMQWDASKNAGFSTADDNKLYLPVHSSYPIRNVDIQKQDKNSLLNFCRQLISYRKQYPTLGNQGDIRFLNTNDQKYPLCYKRTDKSSEFLLIVNPTNQMQTIILDEKVKVFIEVIKNNTTYSYLNNQTIFTIGQNGYSIFKIK